MSPSPADEGARTAVAWPPGATAVVTDLDGPVRHLELGGPTGAPVGLCVHGLGGSALMWGLLAPLLSATHRVLAVDLFGHGGSGVPTGPRPDPVTADRRLLDRFVREVAAEPVVVIGHSMGGVLTVLQAAAAPETVRRLVLLSARHRRPAGPGHRGEARPPPAAGCRHSGRPELAALTPEQVVEQQVRQATPHVDRAPGRPGVPRPPLGGGEQQQVHEQHAAVHQPGDPPHARVRTAPQCCTHGRHAAAMAMNAAADSAPPWPPPTAVATCTLAHRAPVAAAVLSSTGTAPSRSAFTPGRPAAPSRARRRACPAARRAPPRCCRPRPAPPAALPARRSTRPSPAPGGR